MKIFVCFALTLLLLGVLPTTYAKGGSGGGGRSSSSSGRSSSSSGRSSSSSSSGTSWGSSSSGSRSSSSNIGSSSGTNWGSSSNRGSSSGTNWGSSSNTGSSSGTNWGSSSNRGSSSGTNWGSSSNTGSSSGTNWGSSSNRGSSSGNSWGSSSSRRATSSPRRIYSPRPPTFRATSPPRRINSPRPPSVRVTSPPRINSPRPSRVRPTSGPRGRTPAPTLAPKRSYTTSKSFFTAKPQTSRPNPRRTTSAPKRSNTTPRGFFTVRPPTQRPAVQAGNVRNPFQPGAPNSPSYGYYFAQPSAPHLDSKKSQKKKGFLNQLFSPRKPPKPYSKKPKLFGMGHVQPPIGAPSPGMYPFVPVILVKPKKPKSHSKHLKHWFLPHPKRKRRKWKNPSFDFDDDDDDDSRCFRPIPPVMGYASCARDVWRMTCEARCHAGYSFPGNATVQRRECFHMSGIWRPSATFSDCEFICNPKCENGGKCKSPGKCVCDPEYRGSSCQYHILRCDIRSIAIKNRISWSCGHTRKETTCRVGCEAPRYFASPPAPLYRCNIEGVWTPTEIPKCIMPSNVTLTTPKP